MSRFIRLTAAVSALTLGAAQAPVTQTAHAQTAQEQTAQGQIEGAYQVEVLLEGLDRPWGMAFLPGTSDLLITERGGALWHRDGETGERTAISGLPQVHAEGQGGLLDVAIDPRFAENRRIWLSWAGVADGGSTTHLGHAVLNLEAGRLDDLETVFAAGPAVDSGQHFGSRIVFADGHVFMGLGDRGSKAFGPDHVSQRLDSENGSVIRLTLEGEVPADNPFVETEGAAPAIWSYGHRNIQAMTVHPRTGAIWLAEHGEAGGDEINVVQRGGNYGWPLAAFGITYRGGERFAEPHREGDGFIAPAYHWPPGRDAHFPPSGMTFYDGEAFPDWQGHLLMGNLFHRYIGLFAVDGESVAPPVRLLDGQGWRIRDVAVGPEDDFIYVLSDGEGAVLARLVPAGAN